MKQPGATGTYLHEYTDPQSGNVDLFHFAPHGVAEPFVTDPSRFGASPWSASERKAEGTPKSFFYVDLADREHFFSGRPLYHTAYPAAKIYDATRDADSHAERARSITDLIARLRNIGYHGMFYSGVFPTVAMWEPVPMHRHKEPEKPRQLKRRAAPTRLAREVDSEYNAMLHAAASTRPDGMGPHDATPGLALADMMEERGRSGAHLLREGARKGYPLNQTQYRSAPAAVSLLGGGVTVAHHIGIDGGSLLYVSHVPDHYLPDQADQLGPNLRPFSYMIPVHSLQHLGELSADWPSDARRHITQALIENQVPLHTPASLKLARMKAPGGGAIVNNQYAKGGQFLTRAFARVRDVARRLRGTEPMRLGRKMTDAERHKAAALREKQKVSLPADTAAVHAFAAEPVPDHAGFYGILDRLGLVPKTKKNEWRSLTKRELLAIENAVQMPGNLRLSRYPRVAALSDSQQLRDAGLALPPVLRFINDVANRHLTGRRLRSVLGNPRLSVEVRALFHSVSVLDEARRFLHHAGGSPDESAANWYTTAMNPIDVAYHTLFARETRDPLWGSVDWRHPGGPRLEYGNRPVWEHAPAQTLARAVTALLSGQRNPKENADAAARVIAEAVQAARAKGHGNWVMEIPEAQHASLAKWKTHFGATDPNRTDWDGLLDWSRNLAEGANSQGATEHGPNRGYKSTGVYAVADGKGGMHVLGLVTVGEKGKPRIFPGEEKAFAYAAKTKTLQKFDGVPLVDQHGRLKPKSWSSLAAVPPNLRTFKRVMLRAQDEANRLGFANDHVAAFRLASRWLLTRHAPEELANVINDPRIDGPELYGKEPNNPDPAADDVQEADYDAVPTERTRRRREVQRGYIAENTSMPGSWVFGPKFGPFLQNIHGNTPVPEGERPDYFTQWLTPDVWWTRGWRLRQGSLEVGGGEKGKIKSDQPKQHERAAMLKAAQMAAERAKGTPLESVAAIQAADWYATQHLPRLFGVPVDSFSFVHGANHVLEKAGKGHIHFDPSGKLHESAFVEPEAEAAEHARKAAAGPARLSRPLLPPGGIGQVIQDVTSNPVLVALTEALLAIYAPQTARLGNFRLSRPLTAAQGPPMHVAYVSPNQEEGTTFADAARQIASHAQRHLAELADSLPGSAGGRNGYGFWADGAESSRAVFAHDPAALPRIAAELGRAFRQKAVLWFASDPTGEDTLHVLTVPSTNAEQVHRELLRHGVEYKTVLPGDHPGEQVVHVVDSGAGLAPAVEGFARDAGALSHAAHRGKATFVGADDRDTAGRMFEQILSAHVTNPAGLGR